MIIFLNVWSYNGVSGKEEANYSQYAEFLKTLGVFQGTNEGFELDREPTRLEGAIMFVRLLGMEQEAQEKNYSHPFIDVPEWASYYIGFLYEYGYTDGVSDTEFGSNLLITSNQFSTFMLRAMGYIDDIDFQWSEALNFIYNANIINQEEYEYISSKVFLRDDIALMSYRGLAGLCKNGNYLVDELVVSGALERELFSKSEFEKLLKPKERGAKLDTITFIGVEESYVLSQLELGAIDIYGDQLPGRYSQEIDKSGIDKEISSGLSYEIMINPADTIERTDQMNPFHIREVREALNWLIDRGEICETTFNGLAVPKYFPIGNNTSDYTKYYDVFKEYEEIYKQDKEKAMNQINDAMIANGAVKNKSGRWTYNNTNIVINFYVRNDDDYRVSIGEYLTTLLEEVGFSVEVVLGGSDIISEVFLSNLEQGTWHIYTGLWGRTSRPRDSGIYFQDYNSSNSRYGYLPWLYIEISDEYERILAKLAENDVSSLEERDQIFVDAIQESNYWATRIWIAESRSLMVKDSDVDVSFNDATGYELDMMAPYTLQFNDKKGGDLVWANKYPPFIHPINPIGGSNWTYDNQYLQFTRDYLFIEEPETGINLPKRVSSMEVIAEKGLPISKNSDWVTLRFEDEVKLHSDTMVDWDSERQVWITAAELINSTPNQEYMTSKVKSTIVLDDEFDSYTWHDGTKLQLADIMMKMIMSYELADENSKYYDEYSQNYDTIKGWRIVSQEPIVIELYTDIFTLEAEYCYDSILGPSWTYNSLGHQANWASVALGNYLVELGDAFYSEGKAESLRSGVWMNYLSGRSLDYLEEAAMHLKEEAYIPFDETMSHYITKEEAAEAYQAILDFYNRNGHFVIGCGPYYVSTVLDVEGVITISAYEQYMEKMDRWDQYIHE